MCSVAIEDNKSVCPSPTIMDDSEDNDPYPSLSILSIVLRLAQVTQGLYCNILYFCLIDILSHRVIITDIVHYKTLLRIQVMEIKNQHLSRLIASNQVLTIPLNIFRCCISTTKLKDLFSSNCILDPGWIIGLP